MATSEHEEEEEILHSSSNEEEKMSVEEEDVEIVGILDAGAQYGKIIDRRIRELNVETLILPFSTSADEISTKNIKALILSGSGNSVNDSLVKCDPQIFMLGIPVLGICYGYHVIIKHFGGEIDKERIREDGQFEVTLDTSCDLFEGLEKTQNVLLTHGDFVKMLPDCLLPVGWSSNLITAVVHTDLPIYGVQFHPEVDLTVNGLQIFKMFLYKITKCKGLFHMSSREDICIKYIRSLVGDGHVLSLVSGGVDSAVCTALICKALGYDKVTAVHIDNGFMRKNESSQVLTSLQELGINLQVINAALTFSNSTTTMNYYDHEGQVHRQLTPYLHMVTNAEEKRHIIGDTFMKIAKEILQDLSCKGHCVYLAQGTLRPDLIESASALVSTNAHIIKTHHNDTQLVREMRSKGFLVEPLTDFHKDEVRQLGISLGLSSNIINRHPFPGPGLSIRVICQEEAYLREEFANINLILNIITSYSQSILQPNSTIELISECINPSEQMFLMELSNSVSISATVLPIYSVGVQGDSRTYNYVAVLSSNNNCCPWPQIMRLAKLIPKICQSINRVVWAFGGVVCGPITDVTPTHLTNHVLATLREADYTANKIIELNGLLGAVSQMPVVLIPIHFDRNYEERPLIPSCQRSVVLRPFVTSDFMTGLPAVPGEHLPLHVINEIVTKIKDIPGISRVLYDLTPKPPGTTEWE